VVGDESEDQYYDVMSKRRWIRTNRQPHSVHSPPRRPGGEWTEWGRRNKGESWFHR